MFTLTPELSFACLESEIRALATPDLMTVLGVDRGHQTLMRVHTSRPEQYGTRETWPLLPSRWQQLVFAEGGRLYCADPQQVLHGFRDGQDILALGYQAAVAFPVITPPRLGQCQVGAVNLLFTQRLPDAAAGSPAWCDEVAARIDRFAGNLP